MNIRRYIQELAFAWSAGHRASDKIRLATATLAFHVSNALKMRHASPPKCYQVNLIGSPHDLWLRTVGGDLFVLHEIFGSACYALPFDPSRLKIVVDLGANIGITTLYLAAMAPEARFLCVEPAPRNANLLRRNVAVVRHAIVVQAAAANESGTVSFDDTRPTWGGKLADDGALEVRAMSLDDLLDCYVPEGTIDLLKIDIEGAEAELFTGPMAWLDRVDCIIAEIHAPFSFDQFQRILIARGFDILTDRMIPTAVRRRNRAREYAHGVDRQIAVFGPSEAIKNPAHD
jgi:FkbM family methyltransferase